MNATAKPRRTGGAALFAAVLAAMALAAAIGIMLTNDTASASNGPSRQQLTTDQAALAAVYTSLGKPVPNSPVYRWPGVTVQGGRVTHLQINYDSDPGTISGRIGELTALRELHLRGSGIAGALPASVGQMNQLWYLSVDGTGLAGPLPAAELAALPSLDTLIIDDNPSIGGPVPAELGQSTSIRDLILRRNGHTGNIPEELFHDPDGPFGQSPMARNLEHLNFEHNQIAGPIPEKLKLATKLKTIWLGHNQLSGGLPMNDRSWMRMSRLDVMQVHHNRMSGELNPQLPKLMPNLNLISIGDNQWTGCVPETWWQHYNHEVLPRGHSNLQIVGIRGQNLGIPLCAALLESMTASGDPATHVSGISPAFDPQSPGYNILVSNQAERFTIDAKPHGTGQVELNSHEDADEDADGFQIDVTSADALPTNIELSVTPPGEAERANQYVIHAEQLEVDVARPGGAGGPAEGGEEFRLEATAVNAGESVTYLWTQTSGPGAVLRNPTGKILSVTAPTVGGSTPVFLTFQARVTDVATGVYSLQNAEVEVVNTDTPPTGHITMTTGEGGDEVVLTDGGTVSSGTKVTISVSASDDGDKLTHRAEWRQRPASEEYGEWKTLKTHNRQQWKDKYYWQQHYLNDREIEVRVSIDDGTHDPIELTAGYTVTGAGSEYTVRFTNNKVTIPGEWAHSYWSGTKGTHPYPEHPGQRGRCLAEGTLNGVVQYVEHARNTGGAFHAYWNGKSAGWTQVSGPTVELTQVKDINGETDADVPWAYVGYGSYYEAKYDIPQVTEETTLGFRMWADLPVRGAQDRFERFETDVLTVTLHPCDPPSGSN